MLGKLVISYTKKSSKTGLALYKTLKESGKFSKVIRVKDDKVVRQADSFLRWGNASSYNPENTLKINTKEAVANASSKARMFRLLSQVADVKIPQFLFLSNATDEQINALRDADDGLYIRDKNNVIRYDTTINRNTDAYVTKPIDKKREYRVHVFNGKVVGIYEKVPNEDGIKLFKSHNCSFVRVDHANANIRCNAAAQEMCIKAVEAMGLLFGGVDIMREKRTKRFYVSEVNSAPGLNGPNIGKYADYFIKYIEQQRGNNG